MLRRAVPGQRSSIRLTDARRCWPAHSAAGFLIDTIELGRADQRVDAGSALPTAIGADEQIVAACNGETEQRTLGGQIVALDDAALAVTQQNRP